MSNRDDPFFYMCTICHDSHTNVELWNVNKKHIYRYCNDCFLIAHKAFYGTTNTPWQCLDVKTKNHDVLKLCIQRWEDYNEDGRSHDNADEESGSIDYNDAPSDYRSGVDIRNAFGDLSAIEQARKKKRKGG